MSNEKLNKDSVAVQALQSAGDKQTAADLSAIESSSNAADERIGNIQKSLVERLIYGPRPSASEIFPKQNYAALAKSSEEVTSAALNCLAEGNAFTSDKKLSQELRKTVAKNQGYSFTVPEQYAGAGATYQQLAAFEENLASNGLGALAVEISGELTIGAGGLLGYGSNEQKSTFLPLLSEGVLLGFALTEVKVGVNAKKVAASVVKDEANNCWRLNATGDSRKLYITSATHGGLLAVVARIGDSRELGLFITRLPEKDIGPEDNLGYQFNCEPSNVSAFSANINSKLTFENYPIPLDQRIEGDGLEILFYSLRLGRCLLAAMSAGHQRMYAADAYNYAKQRDGVGGRITRHELPRFGLAKILGGALQARSLSHLSLQQDNDGVSLIGLRDITKSAAAGAMLDSLICCERVMGGRSLDLDSRVSQSRATVHAFGIVEGEDDLILLSMARDITAEFTSKCMAGMLSVLNSVNTDKEGNKVPEEKRLLKLSLSSFITSPIKSVKVLIKLLFAKDFWVLLFWIIKELCVDICRIPSALIPASWSPRYADLPKALRPYAKYAERRLLRQRWVYLGLSIYYQLQLTSAQLPMQRFAKRIEQLVSILSVVYLASGEDQSTQNIALFEAESLKDKIKGSPILRGIGRIERLRRSTATIATDMAENQCTLISDIEPQEFAHSWDKE